MIGNNFDTPVMHQDLANYSMSPMNFGMMGMPYANTNYLGGVRMQPQLDHDKLQVINKKKQESKSTLKKALAAMGIILAVGFIPVLGKSIKKAGGVGKFLSNQWTKITNWFKGTPATTSAPKKSFWQKVKGWFKKSPATPATPSVPSTP